MTNELFERELQNTSINDVSMADYVKENYVSRSVLEQIRAEILELPTETWNTVRRTRVLDIIDKYKGESEEQTDETNN